MDKIYKKARSYGLVAFRLNGIEIEYLLIQNKLGQHWSFPKGRPNVGETAEQTAKREFGEETGINDFIFFDKQFSEKYTFTDKDEVIDKEVIYYLARVSMDQDVKPQEIEISDYGWFRFNQALQRFTFEAGKKTLTAVNEELTNNFDKYLSDEK